jgi:hypothetical protein
MHKLNEGHCFLCIVHAPSVSGLDFDWFALHMIYDKSCMWFCIFHFFHVVMFGLGLWVLKSCFSVVVALKAIPTSVFLNRFVILIILGLWYVIVVQILCFFSLCVWLALLCIWWLSLWSKCRGKLLFYCLYCFPFFLFLVWI